VLQQILVEDMEDVGLVLVGVDALQQLNRPVFRCPQTGIMTGRQVIGA